MSESVHSKLTEATERNEHIAHGNRLVPLAAAIVAVLAAIGTLASHHRSISALAAKNEAIILQARAMDRYNAYEARRVRYHVYMAFLSAGLPSQPKAREGMRQVAERESQGSLSTLRDARELEDKARENENHAESILRSYETIEVGTTFFEISIILVSISALSRTPLFLSLGTGLTAFGLALGIYGFFFQGH